ncbi:YggS family pyridoxal phosphate-dependent enzyme [Meridianimarinicoccus aquatilis]|uniref:Pyridoxal phosphate homeostasis protein n=1 Tax=Meridianimarinicoccus aquatilis TaxID=2552766 RepID=A0A4R6AR19_9RHOB|nr:YggS family pyridoxal phosphate-dependent enzyme [Fluviibacterium aquatile]TDL84496.1 YggS family pyridoxal phosphate-dependent enzyme [Fluviibacterium aquatile]
MGLDDIKARIAKAEKSAGRHVGDVQLIAVSKVQPLDRVVSVLEAGHRLFGENKVQEAQGKWPDLKDRFGGVSVHLLGPLQTNKAKAAVELFDTIHSLDREKLARKLADLAQARGSSPDLFVQVNTGEEPQKAGVLPAETEAFVASCRAMDLPLAGLMCIPPAEEEPSLHFALLRKLSENVGLTGLSMGMSGDFETAVALGATHVRVGSAIFGERTYG